MCFVAGASVWTATGLRPIEAIQPGDLVLSRNAEQSQMEPATRYRKVVQTFVSRPDTLYHIHVTAASGATESLGTTGPHPFFVTGRNDFVVASQLRPGDELLPAVRSPGSTRSGSSLRLPERHSPRTTLKLRRTIHTTLDASASGFTTTATILSRPLQNCREQRRLAMTSPVRWTNWSKRLQSTVIAPTCWRISQTTDGLVTKRSMQFDVPLPPPTTTKVIRNCHLAGKTRPVSGVPFDEDGYPIFESMGDSKLPNDLIGPHISDTKQFEEATSQLKNEIKDNPALKRRFTAKQLEQIERGEAYIDGISWRHHQDGSTMQLVDRWIRRKTSHSGGRQVTGGRA